MAIAAMHAAATGMKALDTKLNVVANNLANINTTGFKRSRTNFEDVMYQIRREPGIRDFNDRPIPHGIEVGLGVDVSGTQLMFDTGPVDPTTRKLDVAIEGEGFLQVRTLYNGQEIIAYTRDGNLVRNANGDLVLSNSEGSILEPAINIPESAAEDSITIANNGMVSVRQQGNSQLTQVGQIELARFVNPEGLLSIGKNLFVETDASGTPVTANPMQDGMGNLRQGSLEGSNVEPVRELVDLIFTQRGFELNSQSIKSADEALRVVTNLRQ
ncbi:MAG: flagellar basal-body rod protein FlgG [Phycisphaerae bacterium]|nr:flagellar basal-body rod protein FlgG [Phycisphaerae bacterium]